MSPEQMNEVQFTANVKSWIDAICAQFHAADPDFPFLCADIEVRKGGSQKRRDIIIRPRNKPTAYALTGEVKLPDRPDGRTPYNEALVRDAHNKANSLGVRYFFTWNVNQFVLWKTFEEGTSIFERQLNYYTWAEILDSNDLLRPDIQQSLKRNLEMFLLEFAEIYRGKKPFVSRPLDQRFIHMLECALDSPSRVVFQAMLSNYQVQARFRTKLDQWMVEHLGVTISDEERDDNLQRAAKYASYVLTNRIVFYDALRRKYPSMLPVLKISNRERTAEQLREKLNQSFKKAELATNDYETVFHGDAFGDSLPFITDNAVDSWRELVDQVEKYDFTHLDYDIIGQIFDRLISPRERHRYGQHYTKSEIVDVINAFCIRNPSDVALDPACGGGTFLIRAYARMKYLAEKNRKSITHEALLKQLYGVDISTYAVHLATISLATRDLVRASNYPRIACSDFFDVNPMREMFPAGVDEEDGAFREVPLPDTYDAVIGNPPYIRQERLSSEQKQDYIQKSFRYWPRLHLSGRSDIHVYFWPYASGRLKTGGHFGFLTSSSWLDVEYGFHLQRWILENFAIVAILESSVEPWFSDARVATTVTILRREPDQEKRLSNLVRFVQIRRPLADILEDYERGGDRIEAAQRLCTFLERQKSALENENWRIRVVRQSDLISQAIQSDGESDDTHHHAPNGISTDPASLHVGGKWGINLRAPDVFFDLMDKCGDRLVPLGQIAEVRFGTKTGCDAFFFPRDITDERLGQMSEKEFRETYGITRKQTEKIRVCKAGDGSIHLIEAEYLEPEVHSLMEIDSIQIDPLSLKRKILLVSESKSKLRGTRVLQYIKWGEERGFDNRVTCASRARSTHWYDLKPGQRSDMFWPMIQKYRHIIARNTGDLICNHNLFDIYAKDVNPDLLCALLNCTLVILVKNFHGRWAGTEGTLKTEVIDVNMLPVPDPTQMTGKARNRILKAFEPLSKRQIGYIKDEIQSPDRQQLDLAILAAMGFSDKEALSLASEVYATLDKMYAEYRHVELQANANRARAARRGKSTPQSIASEIWDSLLQDEDKILRLFPHDFINVPRDKSDFYRVSPRMTVEEMFGATTFHLEGDSYDVNEPDRSALLKVAIEEYEGPFPLPHSAQTCRAILADWNAYRQQLDTRFRTLASERSADDRFIERIVSELWRKYRKMASE